MFGPVLTREEANRALEKVIAETPNVVEEIAGLVKPQSSALAATIRAADPECLVGIIEWALPFLRKESRVEGGSRVIFTEPGASLVSRLGNLYAHLLLANYSNIEWRVGDDPDNPMHYAYQNHVVVGLRGGEEEIDPFVVVVNSVRRLLKGRGNSDILLRSFQEWATGIPK